MRDHHHGALPGKLHHQLLDERRGDGVERARGFVHEQHLGLRGQGARDAQALLLAAGKPQARLAELVAYLVPQAGIAQAPLRQLVGLGAAEPAHAARAVQDVVADGHGERIGVLEHHAHPHAQLVGVAAEDVAPRHLDGAFGAHGGNEVAHAVEGAQQRGLAATGRPYERGGAVFRDVERHPLERLEIAVPQVEIADGDHGSVGLGVRAALPRGLLVFEIRHMISRTFPSDNLADACPPAG